MSTKYPTAETVAGDIAGGIVELPSNTPESNLEGPPTLNVNDFEPDVGEVVELPPPEEATPFERLIEDSNLMPVSFLERGVEVQKSVARVVLTKSHRGLTPGRGWGTGFMVSPSLFLTNNHVVKSSAFLKSIRFQFNYQLDHRGLEQTTQSFTAAPDDVFHTNSNLDYSLIRLARDPNSDELPGERWGFIPINAQAKFHGGQHFNIIQHPSGRLKEIALQDNEISELRTNAVRYTCDTEPGSSGSPVLNNLWELVALHHAGGAKSENGKWLNNQGIRLDRIVVDLRQAFADRHDIRAELGI